MPWGTLPGALSHSPANAEARTNEYRGANRENRPRRPRSVRVDHHAAVALGLVESRAGTGKEVLATSDGGCIAAGQTDSFGAGGADGWIVKLDANGSVQWQKTYGGRGFEGFTTIAASPRGYYVGGMVNMQQPEQNAWVLEIDPAGNIIWQEFFDGNHFDHLTSIAATPEGLVFVANSNSDLADKPANVPFFRPWLVCLDPDGAVQWSKTYNVSGGDMWNHIATTRDGGFVAWIGKSTRAGSAAATW